MKVVKNNPVTIELNVGDRVYLFRDKLPTITYIRRIVETRRGLYVVFENDTWRPIESYAKTWSK